VAICGIDGSGKTTQTALLARRAGQEGLSARCIAFPRYGQGFFADLIERYLRGEFASKAGGVNPYLASLPYACDRWEASPQLRQWLAEGRLVICNRYVPANLAHQGAKVPAGHARAEFFRWVETLEYDVFGLPKADLNVLLDVEAEQARELIKRRQADAGGRALADIHERDLTYLRATAEVYRELAAGRDAAWAVIQCAEKGALLSPMEIAGKVWDAVARVVCNSSK